MLAKRIIPCLDVKDGRVVKGVQFLGLKDAGDPVELAAKYSEEGADELVFLDISASHEGRKTMVDVIERTAANITIPFTVGGGINSVDDMKRILRAGADKISLNTAAVLQPDLIKQGATSFGCQCIVVAIDAKMIAPGKWEVFTHGGRNATGRDVLEWALEAERLGAGEILLTSMDDDGEKKGFGIELTKLISQSVHIPVIASGGAGNVDHFYEVLTEGKADAALAASIFHYEETSIAAVKETLIQKGVAIRHE
ncbi:imidazole glycerol phosphate synthase subunit HisF [Brevibacillus daliensis]|uniref:imidazole glycerol phosphate synthase subunit HisF n=1 Tax=Brevibacillus daliensis TaxID=2892995 RepID=UPI001E5CD94C|nr:imidazole glycerol phosphate synthase subunit HisF [Brevibacillus daliensis]